MPPRYRDLQRPALIDTSVIDTGASSAAQALAGVFKSFERVSADRLGGLRRQQGQREGAEAGRSDDPGFRQGLGSLTAYGAAYNDAAMRSYAIKSEIAADETATRLELSAGTDPVLFQTTFSAARDQTIKNAPPEARAVLGEIYDRRLAAGTQRIITAQAVEIKARDRADVAEGLARSIDRIAALRASDDPEAHLQADEEEVKVEMLIDGAQADGTYSEVEAGVKRSDVVRAITEQTVMARFVREFDDPYGDPVGFIERLVEANKKSEALPPEEEEKLVDGLIAELRERNTLAAAKRQRQDGEQAVRWAAGDRIATSMMLEGNLTRSRLLQMTSEDDIDPAVSRTLFNVLQAGDPGVDDERERFYVETTLLEHTEKEIAENGRLSWQTRSALILKRRKLETTWRGTQQAREGAERIDRALGILPSVYARVLSDAEKTAREKALTEWYDAMEGVDPAERQAQVIVKAEEIIERVIKGNARKEIENFKAAIADLRRRHPDPSKLRGAAKRVFDEDLANYERQIKEREALAK